jgi:hypothetical protein
VLIIGSGLAAVPVTVVRTALAAIAIAGCVAVDLLHKQGNLREDFRTACVELVEKWRPGDVVFAVTGTYEGFSQAPVRHYLRDHPEIVATIRDAEAESERLADAVPPGVRVHVIYRDAPYARPQLERFHRQLTWLAATDDLFRVQYLLFRR